METVIALHERLLVLARSDRDGYYADALSYVGRVLNNNVTYWRTHGQPFKGFTRELLTLWKASEGGTNLSQLCRGAWVRPSNDWRPDLTPQEWTLPEPATPALPERIPTDIHSFPSGRAQRFHRLCVKDPKPPTSPGLQRPSPPREAEVTSEELFERFIEVPPESETGPTRLSTQDTVDRTAGLKRGASPSRTSETDSSQKRPKLSHPEPGSFPKLLVENAIERQLSFFSRSFGIPTVTSNRYDLGWMSGALATFSRLGADPGNWIIREQADLIFQKLSEMCDAEISSEAEISSLSSFDIELLRHLTKRLHDLTRR